MKETRSPEARLLSEAAEWRLISTLFSKPDEVWRQEITAAAQELSEPSLKEACGSALEEASEGLYHSLFGPGGPVAPREASYRTTLQLGYLLSELKTYYNSFGYVSRSGETPDHVAVETDFIAYLRLKEALAAALDRSDYAKVTADAAKAFSQAHLSLMAKPLHSNLMTSGVAYLESASKVLFDRVGPPDSSQGPSQGTAEELVTIQDASFSCGTS